MKQAQFWTPLVAHFRLKGLRTGTLNTVVHMQTEFLIKFPVLDQAVKYFHHTLFISHSVYELNLLFFLCKDKGIHCVHKHCNVKHYHLSAINAARNRIAITISNFEMISLMLFT